MEAFSMIFARVMLALVAALITLMAWATGVWRALGFALCLFFIYRVCAPSGQVPPPRRDELNAFQQVFAQDEKEDR